MSGSSTNDGGIIVDVSQINDVEVVDPAGLVRVQVGAIWGDVGTTLARHDLALTSGNFGDTGVGGLATAGGVGYFARSQGLTIDRVRGARLITADGSAHRVDTDNEPDLFWAVRVGGSQLGPGSPVSARPPYPEPRPGCGMNLRRLRDQSGEPTGTPPPAPPVDRLPRHGDLLPERAVVVAIACTSGPRCRLDRRTSITKALPRADSC